MDEICEFELQLKYPSDVISHRSSAFGRAIDYFFREAQLTAIEIYARRSPSATLL